MLNISSSRKKFTKLIDRYIQWDFYALNRNFTLNIETSLAMAKLLKLRDWLVTDELRFLFCINIFSDVSSMFKVLFNSTLCKSTGCRICGMVRALQNTSTTPIASKLTISSSACPKLGIFTISGLNKCFVCLFSLGLLNCFNVLWFLRLDFAK